MADTTTTQDRMVEYEGCGETLRVYESGKIERYHERWNKWKVVKMTRDPDRGYCRIGVNKKGFRAHRVIYAAFNQDFDINDEKILVEHIKGFDNNLSNLRQVSAKTTDNKAQKGYYFVKTKNKWQVQINMGMWETEKEAKEMADSTKDMLGLNDNPESYDKVIEELYALQAKEYHRANRGESYEQVVADLARVTEELEAFKAKEKEQLEAFKAKEREQALQDFERARQAFVSDWVQASIRD